MLTMIPKYFCQPFHDEKKIPPVFFVFIAARFVAFNHTHTRKHLYMLYTLQLKSFLQMIFRWIMSQFFASLIRMLFCQLLFYFLHTDDDLYIIFL